MDRERARVILYLKRFWKRFDAPSADRLQLLQHAANAENWPGDAPRNCLESQMGFPKQLRRVPDRCRGAGWLRGAINITSYLSVPRRNKRQSKSSSLFVLIATPLFIRTCRIARSSRVRWETNRRRFLLTPLLVQSYYLKNVTGQSEHNEI